MASKISHYAINQVVCLVSHSLRNDEVNQVDSGLFPLENTLLFKAWEMDNRRKGNALIVRTPRLWPRVCWLNCFVDKFVVSLNFTFLNYKTNNKKWISSILYFVALSDYPLPSITESGTQVLPGTDAITLHHCHHFVPKAKELTSSDIWLLL